MKELKEKITLDNLNQMTDVNTYNGAFDATQILSAAFLTMLQDNLVINRVKSPVSGDSTSEEDDDIFFNFGFENSHYKNSKTQLANRNTSCEYVTMFTQLWNDLGREQYGDDVCDIMLKGFCLDLDKKYEAKLNADAKNKDDNYVYKSDTTDIFDLIESFNPLWNEEDYNAGLLSDSYDEKFEESIDIIIDILDREITLAESEAQRLKEIKETIDIESIKSDSILLFNRYVPLKGYFSNTSDSEIKNDNGKYTVAIYPKEENINSKGQIDPENGKESTVYYVYSIPDSKSSWGWKNRINQKDKIKFNNMVYAEGIHFVVGNKGYIYAYPDTGNIDTLDRYKLSNGIQSIYDLKDIVVDIATSGTATGRLVTIVAVGTNGSIYTKTTTSTFNSSIASELNKTAWKKNIVFNMTNYNAITCATTSMHPSEELNGKNKIFVAVGENGFMEYSFDGLHWVMDRGPNTTLRDIIYTNGALYMLTDEGIYFANPLSIIQVVNKFEKDKGFKDKVNILSGVSNPNTVTFNKCWSKLSFAEPVSCIFASKDKTLCLVVKGSNIIYRYIGNNKYVRIEDSIGIADSVEVKKVVFTGTKYVATCTKGCSYLSSDLIRWTGLCGISNSYTITGLDVSSNNKCNCVNTKGEVYSIDIANKTDDVFVSLNLAVDGLGNDYIKAYYDKGLVYSADIKQIRCKDARSALAIAKHYVEENSFN